MCSKSELLCTLSHVWPFGLRYLVYVVHFKLFHSLQCVYIVFLYLENGDYSCHGINLAIVSFV